MIPILDLFFLSLDFFFTENYTNFPSISHKPKTSFISGSHHETAENGYSRTSIIRTSIDYLAFFLWSRFLWILISCHLENLKLQIDRLNHYKRLSKQRFYLCSKVGREGFWSKRVCLNTLDCYEYLNKKRIFVSTYKECVNFVIKIFLCCSHVIYNCISLIFIFSIIRTLDYPDYLPRSRWVQIIEVWL